MPPVAAVLATQVVAGITVGQLLFTAGVLIYNQRRAARLRRRLRDAAEAQEPPKQTVRQAVPTSRFVVGRYRVYGVLSDLREWAITDKKRTLSMTLLFSNAPCDAIERVWVGTRRYRVTAGSTGGRMTLVDETGDGNGAFLSSITSVSCRLDGGGTTRKGVAWLNIQLTVDETSGEPILYNAIPEVSVTMRGMKHRGSPATWSANAADVTYWYMRTVMQIPVGEIDQTSYTAARNYCSTHGLEAHGVIDSAENPRSVMEALTNAWDGAVVDDGEKYRFVIPTGSAVSATIEEKHVVAEPRVLSAPELSARINVAEAQYADYSSVISTGEDTRTAQRRNEAAIRADGGELTTDLGTLRFVVSERQAQFVLEQALLDRQIFPVFTLQVPHGDAADPVKFLELIPGETVRVLLPSIGTDFIGRLIASQPVGEHELSLTVQQYTNTITTTIPAAPAAPTVAQTAAGAVADISVPAVQGARTYYWEVSRGGVVLFHRVTSSPAVRLYGVGVGTPQHSVRVQACAEPWAALCSVFSAATAWTQMSDSSLPAAGTALAAPTVTAGISSVTAFVTPRSTLRTYQWNVRRAGVDEATVQTTGPSVSIGGLQSETSYTIRVRGCTGTGPSPDGCTAWSSAAFTTLQIP